MLKETHDIGLPNLQQMASSAFIVSRLFGAFLTKSHRIARIRRTTPPHKERSQRISCEDCGAKLQIFLLWYGRTFPGALQNACKMHSHTGSRGSFPPTPLVAGDVPASRVLLPGAEHMSRTTCCGWRSRSNGGTKDAASCQANAAKQASWNLLRPGDVPGLPELQSRRPARKQVLAFGPK